jgi:hypothetical protein
MGNEAVTLTGGATARFDEKESTFVSVSGQIQALENSTIYISTLEN